ncbi:hypothetical protein NG798_04965 [Ancylothrix sp. C2]|uniref:hypothetical protein n=1 Tax=Ancylothrix sp. D3o TaxID=2953691 RepID=UPI0021BAAE55|nr:hypothetical protein [Ancylothrix sp. D3o]MCT7949130.1 hypothetical protein [Ancylothrix sp. D3o]
MNATKYFTLIACLQCLAKVQETLPEQVQEKINQAGKLLATDEETAISMLRQAVISYDKLKESYQSAYDDLFSRYNAQKRAKTRIEDDEEDESDFNYFLENQLPPLLPKLGEILSQPNPGKLLQDLATTGTQPPEEQNTEENTFVEIFMGISFL